MNVHLPESVDEAVALLDAGVLLAGGTSVMPHVGPTTSLVSLRRTGLAGIAREGDTLRIGAATTLAQVGREVDFLHAAIESIASPTIRNLATVGGNLFARQPHGDLAVCLLALDAKVSIVDAGGARDVGVLEAEGLVTAVSFKVPERWFYTKAISRKRPSCPSRLPTRSTTPTPARGIAAACCPSTFAERSRGNSAMPSRVIELEVNGEPQEFLAQPGTTLLSALRDNLGLTATKRGCAQGTCGT
jgi:carbon-monoxide dehydrogenase medium subunit